MAVLYSDPEACCRGLQQDRDKEGTSKDSEGEEEQHPDDMQRGRTGRCGRQEGAQA